jgi:hypothetical protein
MCHNRRPHPFASVPTSISLAMHNEDEDTENNQAPTTAPASPAAPTTAGPTATMGAAQGAVEDLG